MGEYMREGIYKRVYINSIFYVGEEFRMREYMRE